MSEEEAMNLRPAILLDDWLRVSGRGKNRHPSGKSAVYGYFEELTAEGEFRSKWLPVALGDDPGECMKDGYLEIVRRYMELHKAKQQGNESHSILCAMLVMAYGEGMVARKNPDAPEDTVNTELMALSKVGFVPTRVVSLISMEGTASETTMFAPGMEPHVERFEMWAGEDDGSPELTGVPSQSSGDLDQMMAVTFTVLVLLGNAVEDGLPPTIGSLIRKAREYRHVDGGEQVWEMMQKFVAQVSEMRNEVQGLFDEIAGIMDDD